MPTIVIPDNVLPSPAAAGDDFTCGEPFGLEQGDWVYLDDDDLDANGTGRAHKAVNTDRGMSGAAGCCANKAAFGQPVTVVTSDPAFNPGFPCDPGVRYALSNSSARIAAITGLGPGQYLTDVGYGNADRTLNMTVVSTFVAQTTTTTTTTSTTTTTTTTTP